MNQRQVFLLIKSLTNQVLQVNPGGPPLGDRSAFTARRAHSLVREKATDRPRRQIADEILELITKNQYHEAIAKARQHGVGESDIAAIEREYETGNNCAGRILISLDEVEALFGGIPHEMKGEPVDEIGLRPYVQKILSGGVEKGHWVVKELIYACGVIEKGVDLASSDLFLRNIMGAYFPQFVVPDAYYYSKGGDTFVVSQYLDVEENREHYCSMGPKLRAELAVLAMIFGLSDLRIDNLPKIKSMSYEAGTEHFDPAEGKGMMKNRYAILDPGLAYLDEPRKVNFSGARSEIKIAAPFLHSERNNKIDDYLSEFERWKSIIEDDKFLKSLYLIAERSGKTREFADAYYGVLRKALDNFVPNMDAYCASSNGELPKLVLEQVKWRGNPNPQSTDMTFANLLIEDFNSGSQIFIDLNKGWLLYVEALDSGELKVQSIYSNTNAIIIPVGENITVGKSSDADLSLDGCGIAPRHLLIQNHGNGKVTFNDEQDRNQSDCSTEYWL